MQQLSALLFGLIYQDLMLEDIQVDPQVIRKIVDKCAAEVEAMTSPFEELEFQVYTIHQAAHLLKCSSKTVRGFIRNGQLKATQTNPGSKKPRFLVTSESIHNFLQGQKGKQGN